MKRTIGILVILGIILAMAVPVFAGKVLPVPTALPQRSGIPQSPSTLLSNGMPVPQADNGEYILTEVGTCILTATAPVKGNVTIDGTGVWTLGSAITTTGQVTVLKGTLNTAGYALTCPFFYAGEYNAVNPVTVSLGSSVITTEAFGIRNAGVVFDAGTSTINANRVFGDGQHNGKSFNKVAMTGDYPYIEGKHKIKVLDYQATGKLNNELRINDDLEVNENLIMVGESDINKLKVVANTSMKRDNKVTLTTKGVKKVEKTIIDSAVTQTTGI